MEKVKYNDLIIKKFADELTEAEEKELQTWLSDSKANREGYQKMQKLWVTTNRAQEIALPNIDEEWIKLENKLQLDQEEKSAAILKFEQKPLREKAHFFQTRWIAYVAAAVLLILIGTNLFDGDHQTVEFTQNAQTKKITLPDGSEVRLNNDSQLSYDKSFSDGKRLVTLQGEAFFSVTSNQDPFIVMTDNSHIRVLGTEFNVWARNEETRIIVSEGSVSFRSAKSEENEDLVLTANQMAINKPDQIPVLLDSAIDAKTQIGWLEGRIVFNETGLQEVVEELNRIYDVKIELQSTALKVLSISGSFQKKPLVEILEAICLTLDLQYKVEEGKYVLDEI